MSRTYRKASRWFAHYNGEVLNNYKDVSLNIYPKIEEVFGEDYWKVEGISRIYKEVLVGDVGNYKKIHANSDDKQMHRQIDRRRLKNALDKAVNDGEGCDSGCEIIWASSFDPWSYD